MRSEKKIVRVINILKETLGPGKVLLDKDILEKYYIRRIYLKSVPTSIELRLQTSDDNYLSSVETEQVTGLPFMANAFSIFLLRQFFSQVPDELWDAARMDGAGHLRFLVQIVLPISKAPLMTVLLFGFIGSWNAFMWPLLVTTKDVSRPLMVGLWNFVTEAGPQTHLLMAGAVITLIPILIVYFITQKQFTEGIATTGLKG